MCSSRDGDTMIYILQEDSPTPLSSVALREFEILQFSSSQLQTELEPLL